MLLMLISMIILDIVGWFSVLCWKCVRVDLFMLLCSSCFLEMLVFIMVMFCVVRCVVR